MSTVGTLNVRIVGDSSHLEGELKRSSGAVTKWAAATAAAAVAATAAFVRAGLQSADAQMKLARRLDGTAEAMGALERTAARAGISSGELDSAISRLNQKLGEARLKGGEAAETLKQLGLDAEELSRMDIDERMAAIANSIQRLGLDSAQTAQVLRTLGIRQSSIINLMRQGGAAIEESRKRIQQYGLALKDIDAQKIEAANDAMGEFSVIIRGVQQQLAVQFAPILERMANRITDAVARMGNLSGRIESAFKTATTVVEVLALAVGARLVAALVAATAAKVSATTSAIAYQAALARMAGVSALAAARQTMLAASVGAARAAMALLGGPVGAVTLAATALIYFRKELGITTPIEKMRDHIDDLRISYMGMGEEALIAAQKEVEASQARLQMMRQEIETQNEMANLENPYWMSEVGEGRLAKVNEQMGTHGEMLDMIAERLANLRGEGAGEFDSEDHPIFGKAFSDEETEKLLEKIQTQLDAIDEAGMSEIEMTQARHDALLAILDEGRRRELLLEDEYRAYREKAEQQHSRKMVQLKLQEWNDILSGFGQYSDKMFRVSKIFSAGQSLIATIQGQAQALRDLPFPANLAAAAKVGAAGFGFVSAIRGATPTSALRLTGTDATIPTQETSGPTAATGTTSGQVVQIALQGEIFGREQVRNLISQINESIADGAVLRLA